MVSEKSEKGLLGTIAYLKTLISDPDVASVTPTSRFAVRRVLSRVDFRHADLIVEYGPGLGVFTEELLRQMKPEARLVLFEKNENFVEKLRLRFSDSRVRIVSDSCENILEYVSERKADYIISGIPFSMLDDEVKKRVLTNTSTALKPDGRFLTYQFFPLPASMDKFLRKPLDRDFEFLDREYEFRNVPPLRIYESRPKHSPKAKGPFPPPSSLFPSPS